MISSLLVAALLAQGYYTPEEAQAVFAEANDAYYREDYDAAREGFLKLLERGHGGPDVLYNLGTTYLAAGQLGEAVLYLERARRAGGRAEDLEANLALARARQLDQVIGAQGDEPFLQRVVAATDEPAVSWGFLLSWLAGFGLLLLFRRRSPGRRTWLAIGAAASLLVAVGCGLLVAAHAFVEATVREAVVLSPSLEALELPREAARVSFEVHAGLKVRLLESSGKFVKIRLPNGLEGWAEKDGVAQL